MMQLSPATAELNNLGVAHLDNGDLRRALDLFRDALKYAMGDDPKQNTAQTAQATGAVFMSLARQSQIDQAKQAPGPARRRYDRGSEAMEKVNQVLVAREAKPAPTSFPFVHARGINVIPSPTAYSPNELVNLTVVSSIIIFNLGIVYHLKGLEEGTAKVTRLNKAWSLYQKSHLLLVDAGVPLGATGNPVIDMLSMALFNNLAQASYELASYNESQKYFDHLIRFALTVLPARYGDAHIGSVLDQLKSNFLLNAIILHPPKLAPAA